MHAFCFEGIIRHCRSIEKAKEDESLHLRILLDTCTLYSGTSISIFEHHKS